MALVAPCTWALFGCRQLLALSCLRSRPLRQPPKKEIDDHTPTTAGMMAWDARQKTPSDEGMTNQGQNNNKPADKKMTTTKRRPAKRESPNELPNEHPPNKHPLNDTWPNSTHQTSTRQKPVPQMSPPNNDPHVNYTNHTHPLRRVSSLHEDTTHRNMDEPPKSIPYVKTHPMRTRTSPPVYHLMRSPTCLECPPPNMTISEIMYHTPAVAGVWFYIMLATNEDP
ncbi:hypothetical protein BS47DRAFT_1366372 [Hydnum rufescens UP504]|uniref:Uncharacterized protein n=1 Tax=Hydnum rufescens UP504 TaxID=1448309 RepID=A0A9P6AL11_9AGAM|nr:hypothetical protein BS47DRAFT_1366372 [Hydnum rufescens UP504]